MSSKRDLSHFHGVILAGGRGTRFWPRSRRTLPKQLLPVVGGQSLIRQTAERLKGLVPAERLWVLTSETLRKKVIQEVPEVPRRQVIAEPVQRNTGPAIGLAARLLQELDPDAVMGVFPSDHFIEREATFRKVLQRAVQAASDDRLVVLGIPPRGPERLTAFGVMSSRFSGCSAAMTDTANVNEIRMKQIENRIASLFLIVKMLDEKYFYHGDKNCVIRSLGPQPEGLETCH